MTSFNRDRTTWTAELLERRTMLDGAVSAALRDGALIVRGDADDNQIVITQPNARTIRIAGLDGTKVNGRRSVNLRNPAGDITILMQKGGEDHVEIQGPFVVAGDLRGALGAGEILVEGSAGSVRIGGDLAVRTGEDGHVTLRNEVQIAGAATIEAGGDASVVAGLATVPDFSKARFDDSLNIDNPYFPLVPGSTRTYEAEVVDDETGEITTEQIIVEVLNETLTIQGVKVRVVRDRVFEEGVLIEDTFDWHAQDNNGNVWYFGEDVTNYEYDDEGNLIGTNDDGSWKAGVDGAQAGIIMEARPRVGHVYYQEFAPGNVLDQAVGLATNQTATVPVGTFTNVFRTKESSVVEPFALANKLYAPGLGTIAEFDFDIEDDEIEQTTLLTSVTLNGKPVTQLVPTTGFTGVNATGRFVGGIEIDGEASIEAEGPVVLNGATFADELEVQSGDALIVVDSVLEDEASFGTEDTVSLRGIFAKDEVEIESEPDDVYIFDSRIARFEVIFGDDDNTLTVRGSRFGVFNADGGGGDNTFDDQGGNSFGRRRVTRFSRA